MLSEVLTKELLSQLKNFVDKIVDEKFLPIFWSVTIYRFREMKKLYPNSVGFTLMESSDKYQYSFVQGMFNPESGRVNVAYRIQSNTMDEEAQSILLQGPKLKIYSA